MLPSHSTPRSRPPPFALDGMSVPEVPGVVREREPAADANAAKKPKTAPKPKAAPKPKSKAVKDQPHVVVEVPHNGPSGQSIKRSYGRLKILGLYPDKARAERAAKAYIQRKGGDAEAFGTGYPNLEGDTWDSQLQVIVRHAGEMIA